MSGDPFEFMSVGCSGPPGAQCVAHIMVVNYAGSNPGRFKYVLFRASGRLTLSPATSSGAIYGHANAQGAMAVGAANYQTPTTLESFSSGGTTPVLFDTAGNLLTPADPRQFKQRNQSQDGEHRPRRQGGDGCVLPGFIGI